MVIRLTERELEILHLVSLEFTNEQIANSLFLNLETIRSHRKKIMIKLNANNTAGMIRRAFEEGILRLKSVEIPLPS